MWPPWDCNQGTFSNANNLAYFLGILRQFVPTRSYVQSDFHDNLVEMVLASWKIVSLDRLHTFTKGKYAIMFWNHCEQLA